MPNEPKLKPCPVCGCKNVLVARLPIRVKKYICECDHCGYCSKPMKTEEAAIVKWNYN